MMPVPTETGRVYRGLHGVVVDDTAVSQVDPASDSLTYRGYPVRDLAEGCRFEEVAHLLWHGELPDAAQLSDFTAREREHRQLSRTTRGVLGRLPDTCHPMDVLRTAVSQIGAEDPTEDDSGTEVDLAKAMDLWAKIPTVVAMEHRRRRGLDPIMPEVDLGFTENFFHMCFGREPDERAARAFDASMTLYAEHSFNASTFTARVVASTRSDLHSAVTGAIGALKGTLHGGANEAVVHMLREIGPATEVPGWLTRTLSDKRLVMGFGHRVYKDGDSRVPTMQAHLDSLTEDGTARTLMDTHHALAAEMVARTGIHPNLDYPSGPAYHVMGFDVPSFTPIFVMSRITGWTAHIMEQLRNNTLIRPLSRYVGPHRRPVPSGAVRLTGRWR
jgi:citrate synthase